MLQETKEHEAALAAGMRAALARGARAASPANVADQFEQGRARMLAPGQDPRPKYWEHYADFYRLLKQQGAGESLPHAFVEAFGQEYARARAQLRDEEAGRQLTSQCRSRPTQISPPDAGDRSLR